MTTRSEDKLPSASHDGRQLGDTRMAGVERIVDNLVACGQCDTSPANAAQMYDALLRQRAQVKALLGDLIAECGELAWTMVDELTRRELGVPSIILGPLHARLHARQCAVDAAQAELVRLDAICNRLHALLSTDDTAPHS